MKKLLSEQEGKDLMNAAHYMVFKASRWVFARSRRRVPVQQWEEEVLFIGMQALETWEEKKGASPKSWCYGKMDWAVRSRILKFLSPYVHREEYLPPPMPKDYVNESRFDKESFWKLAEEIRPKKYITAALQQMEGVEIKYQGNRRVVEFEGEEVTAAWIHAMYTKVKNRLRGILKEKHLELDDFYY